MQEEIGTRFESVVVEKSRAIAEILNSKIEEARILATHPYIITALHKAKDRYVGLTDDEAFASINAFDQEWINKKKKTKKAREVAAHPLSEFFREYQDRNPDKYGEIFVTDVKGANVAMTKALSDYYQADEVWWKGGYNDGKGGVFIDDRGFDESVGSIVAGVVIPVIDNGEVLGILKINYKVKDVIDVVMEEQSKEGVEVLLARSSGTLVATSRLDKQYLITEEEFNVLSKRTSGWQFDFHEGRKMIFGYAPIDSPIYSRILPPGAKKGAKGERWHKTTWFTIMEIDQDVAFSSVMALTNFYIFGGTVTALLVIFVALILAGNISRPIQHLRKGTQIIADGDLSYRFSLNRSDEIGDLSSAFNEMTENIQKSMLSQRKLSRAIEQSPSMVVITDVDAIIEYANPKILDFMGYASEDVIGKYTGMFQSGETPKEIYEDLWQTILSGKDWSGEIKNKRKDGTKFWENLSISSVKNEDGDITNFIAIHQDLTERKQAEDKMKASLAEKEVLLQEIHHRVKNNLMVVSSLLSLQANAETDHRVVLALQESERRVSVMAKVHESLYLSENMAQVNTASYLNSIIDGIERGHIGSNASVLFDVDVEDITLEIDQAIPIGQIVNELISNSMKYAFPNGGEGRVNISLKQQDKKNILLSVADNGIGIPEGVGFDSPKTLGLKLVKGLAGSLAGDVTIDRSQGTRFQITFEGVGL